MTSNNIYLRAGYFFLLLATSGSTVALWLFPVTSFFKSPANFLDDEHKFLILFAFSSVAISVLLFYSVRYTFLGRVPRNGLVLYAGLVAGFLAGTILLSPMFSMLERLHWGTILLAFGPLVPGMILVGLFHRAGADRG